MLNYYGRNYNGSRCHFEHREKSRNLKLSVFVIQISAIFIALHFTWYQAIGNIYPIEEA